MEKYRASHLLVFNTPVEDPREAALSCAEMWSQNAQLGFLLGAHVLTRYLRSQGDCPVSVPRGPWTLHLMLEV